MSMAWKIRHDMTVNMGKGFRLAKTFVNTMILQLVYALVPEVNAVLVQLNAQCAQCARSCAKLGIIHHPRPL